MADGDGATDIVDLSGNGKGVALNVYPHFFLPEFTTAQRLLMQVEDGRLIYDTDTNKVYVGDGITLGGILLGPGGTGAAPINTVVPTISGTVSLGQTLTVSNGTWVNSPTSYTYQWKRAGVAIGGATAQTYVLVNADDAVALTCTVTAINVSGSASSTSGPVTLAIAATFVTPNQTLLIKDATNSIVTNKSAAITANGASIGTSVSTPPTLLYTPTALNDAVTLATPDTSILAMVVAANGPQTLSGGGCSYVTGRPDWNGGTTGVDIVPATGTARRLIDVGAIGRPSTTPNSGMEFWVSDPMNASLDGFSFYDKLHFRFVNGAWQYGGKGGPVGTAYPVERKQASDGVWGTRWWFRLEAGKVNDSAWMDLLNALNDTVAVASATAAFRFAGIRYIDGIMNMPKYQRIDVRDHIVAIDGGANTLVKSRPNTLKKYYFGPFQDGTASLDSTTGYGIEILFPTTYDRTRPTPYDAVLIPKVEPVQNVYNGEIAGNGSDPGSGTNQGLSYNQTLIDALDVVVISPETSNYNWGGVAASGKYDYKTLFGQALPDALLRQLNIKPILGLMGFSKAALTCLYMLEMFPTRFKFASLMDGPFGRTYASMSTYFVGTEFETQAAYDAYDPVNNLAARKSTLVGRTPISLATGDTFAAEYANFKALLTSQGISFRDKGNLTAGLSHNYFSQWGNTMLTEVVGLMRGTLS